MAYPALTKEKLEECEELGLTESQIRKINEKVNIAILCACKQGRKGQACRMLVFKTEWKYYFRIRKYERTCVFDLSIYISIYLSIYLSTYLSIYLSIYMYVWLFDCFVFYWLVGWLVGRLVGRLGPEFVIEVGVGLKPMSCKYEIQKTTVLHDFLNFRIPRDILVPGRGEISICAPDKLLYQYNVPGCHVICLTVFE